MPCGQDANSLTSRQAREAVFELQEMETNSFRAQRKVISRLKTWSHFLTLGVLISSEIKEHFSVLVRMRAEGVG